MRPLRYSINVTLDGCCDHRVIPAGEELHRHAADSLARADVLLFGRITYELMEAGWRPAAAELGRPEWMEPFAATINAAKKYVVSSTLDSVDWNAELIRGDLRTNIEQLKSEPGEDILLGGVTLPRAFAAMGLIDDYEFVVHLRIAGHGPAGFAGLADFIDSPRGPSRIRLGRRRSALRDSALSADPVPLARCFLEESTIRRKGE